VNPRKLLQSAQAAEREGDLARAGALLEQAAQIYESTGHSARAAQMRRHVERLGPAAGFGSRGVEEPAPGRLDVPVEAADPEALPGLDRPLMDRTPTLADPTLEAWCSFCCRPSREVGALVAGPSHAYVCRACVSLAGSLLDQARDPVSSGAAPGTSNVDPDLPTTRRLRAFDSARGTPVPGPRPTGSGAALFAEESSASPSQVGTPLTAPGPRGSDPAREAMFQVQNRTGSTSSVASGVHAEPLPTQVEAVARIEGALGAGHARVLLVGAAGSGKSTWLRTWAGRGLGTAWDGILPIPEHGPLLVDDVDRLEPAARRQLARVLPTRPVVLALDATLPEPEQEVGGRRVHAPEQVESLAGSWLPGPVLDGLTLECFRAPGEDELRLLAERWRAPDGSPAQPDALEEALRLAMRSGRAAHALHALLLRWWASR
jgi:hypothetical protein